MEMSALLKNFMLKYGHFNFNLCVKVWRMPIVFISEVTCPEFVLPEEDHLSDFLSSSLQHVNKVLSYFTYLVLFPCRTS